MREGFNPSLLEQDAPKSEAEAQKNQEHFQAMNQLFMADRDGKDLNQLLASNSELAKSAKEILDSKEYNPEGLSMSDLKGQFARESTQGEDGSDNKWKNMVQLKDGRSVANPFAVAAGLGRKMELGVQEVESVKKPDVAPSVVPENGIGDNGAAEHQRTKAERDVEQAKVDADEIEKIKADFFKEEDSAAPSVSLGERGNMHRTERREGELHSENKTVELPGMRMTTEIGDKMRLSQAEADMAEAEQQAQRDLQTKMLEAAFHEETPDQNLSAGSRDENGFDYRGANRREDRENGPATVKLPTGGKIRSIWNKLLGTSKKEREADEADHDSKKFDKAA